MVYFNLLFLCVFVWAHWRLSKTLGWFQHDHMRLPRTLSFALGVLGIVIPFTPLFLDGMVIGATVYFLSEWAYQKKKWSPITYAYNWVKKTPSSSQARDDS